MDIEDVFSSRLRIKILRHLSHVGEINISAIARRLGVNHQTASRHLEILEDEGILQHKTFGRIHLYRFNQLSIRAKALQSLIETWEDTTR